MKNLKFFALTGFLLAMLACDKSSDLTLTEDVQDTISNRSWEDELPMLSTDYSRAFHISNSGAIVGSTKDEEGKTVAFKLSQQGLWLSEEEVKPVFPPEAKFCVNDRGDVVGHKVIPGGFLPMFWDKGGQAYDLEILPGFDYGTVWDINASGQMVGACLIGSTTTPSAARATVFSIDGPPVNIGTLGGTKSEALAINDVGAIVGVSRTSDDLSHAFLYQDGVMQDLGTLGGTTSNANAINNCGEIVGRAFLPNGSNHAFHYYNGVMTDLGTLGGLNSVAYDINDRGEIVGFSRIANNQIRAFLYKEGVMHDLGAMGGIESRAIGINNRGDIVGFYVLADGSTHAFLYRDGVMMPL